MTRSSGSLADWETAELEAAWRLAAKTLGTGREGRATPGAPSSLRMLQPLLGLILGYHGRLAGAWVRMAVRLEVIAQDPVANTAVGHALVESQLLAAITPAVTTFLDAAGEFAPKAWAVGSRAAVKWTGVQRVTDETAATKLRAWQEANAAYVTERLFATVYDGLREILVNPALPVKAGFVRTLLDRLGGKAPPRKTPSMLAYEAAQALAAKHEKKLASNANSLWGLAHEAFKEEIELETAFIMNWVTTSEEPCPDCLKLEDEGPYGPGNPLPTVPGAGATVCRQNCMCILEAAGTDPILEGRRKDPSKPNPTLYRGGDEPAPPPKTKPKREAEPEPEPEPELEPEPPPDAPEPEPQPLIAPVPAPAKPAPMTVADLVTATRAQEAEAAKPRDWNALPRSYGLGKEGREEFRKMFDKATKLAPELARTVTEIVQQPLGKRKLAQYNPNNGVLTLNDRVFKKGKYEPQPGEENWFAVPTVEGIAMHELGHAVEKLIRLKGIRIPTVPAVSDYAKTSQQEAFAEAFAAYSLGKHGKSEAVQVVKDALAAYRKALKA